MGKTCGREHANWAGSNSIKTQMTPYHANAAAWGRGGIHTLSPYAHQSIDQSLYAKSFQSSSEGCSLTHVLTKGRMEG